MNRTNEFWQALDVIHIWVDSHPQMCIFLKGKQIVVSSPHDTSQEAAIICKFISIVIEKKWSYQTNKENDKFFYTFIPGEIEPPRLIQKTLF
ncbi:MAG: hypothetical protein LBR10_09915 [Prevotellaceae bacterium]|jgi:hypothetical protein|nr:hypothetical protein [Prevotellaceae bacterium]